MNTEPDGTEPTLSATVDPTYNASEHNPFAPVENGELPAPSPDGWELLDLIHEGTAETEKYVLDGDEWAYVGTDTETVELHQMSWEAPVNIPGLDDSTQARVLLEYEEKAIHHENGEPVEMAPGYTAVCLAADDSDELVAGGDIILGTFRNLAAALRAVSEFMHRVTSADADALSEWTPPEGTGLDDLFDEIGLPAPPAE